MVWFRQESDTVDHAFDLVDKWRMSGERWTLGRKSTSLMAVLIDVKEQRQPA
jgi:hypothetical protein